MSTTFLAELGRHRAGAGRSRPAGRAPAGGRRHRLHRAALRAAAPARRARRARAGPCRRRARSRRPARAASHRTTRWRSRPPRGCCSPRGIDSRRTRSWSSSRRFRTSTPTPTTPPPCPRSCAPRSPSAQPELADRLVDGVEPRTPLAEHALCACRAQLAEAAGDHAEAAALYAEAAERWREFGNVPERAYALLGQGRCLAALGQPEARGAAARGARAVRIDGLPAGARRDGCAARANDRSGLVGTTTPLQAL